MNKTKEQLLASYKKSNKQRRARLIQKAGFSTETEYLDFILGKKVPKAKVVKTPSTSKIKTTSGKKKVLTVHNVHIVDCSGSMGTVASNSKKNPMTRIKAATIGVNEEIAHLAKDKGVNYLMYVYGFNSNHKATIHADGVPIGKMSKLKFSSSGGTKLTETVGKTLEELSGRIPASEKVLVKIFTDGQENSSTGVWYGADGAKRLSSLIEKLSNRNFTVTFIGTESDTKEAIRLYGLHASNTLSHDNTSEAIMDTLEANIDATRSYTKKLKKGEDVSKGFYKKIGKI